VQNRILPGGKSTAGRASEAVLSKQSLVSVVDDDPAFRSSMRRLLKSLGYAVEEFPSAADFLSSAQLGTTSCLVADVQMPDMTGIDLYRHLVDSGRAIPTILITAYPDDRVRRRSRRLGITCYLPKPLDEAVLIGCLHSAVAHARNLRGAS
jgi:FixJ family two-component response regulator